MRSLTIVMSVLIGLSVAEPHALTSGPAVVIHAQQPAQGDAEFLQQAGQVGEAEIAWAALAQKQAKDDRVKALADLVKRDHEAARTELQKLAKPRNTELTAMTVAQLAVHERLQKLTGSGFDRAWLNEMIAIHRDARGLYSRASRSANEEVKSFATRQGTMLEDHLKRAKQVQAEITK